MGFIGIKVITYIIGLRNCLADFAGLVGFAAKLVGYRVL